MARVVSATPIVSSNPGFEDCSKAIHDEPNYGQGVANLQGTMGATPAGQPDTTYTEDTQLRTLFAARTGIKAIEETLAEYGTADNAPQWLRLIFNELKAKFGESVAGSGVLSIGDGGSGKHCNNQQIVGVPETDGQVYQYSQLDSALSEFQAAYAKARASGQAVAMAWDSSSGVPAPSESYNSTSYQTFGNWYA